MAGPQPVSAAHSPLARRADAPAQLLEVDSIDETLRRSRRTGPVVMAKAPISDTSWYAAFEDSEGNQMGLSKASPRRPDRVPGASPAAYGRRSRALPHGRIGA